MDCCFFFAVIWTIFEVESCARNGQACLRNHQCCSGKICSYFMGFVCVYTSWKTPPNTVLNVMKLIFVFKKNEMDVSWITTEMLSNHRLSLENKTVTNSNCLFLFTFLGFSWHIFETRNSWSNQIGKWVNNDATLKNVVCYKMTKWRHRCKDIVCNFF